MSSTSARDFYDVLGVQKGASKDDIKAAYRKLAMQFMEQVRNDDRDGSPRANKLRDISQIEIIRAEVMVGIEADDGIKELVSKRQTVGFGVERKDLLFSFGLANALPVVTATDPQISGLYLQVKFLSQEDGGESLATA